jgi:hypothetical protein
LGEGIPEVDWSAIAVPPSWVGHGQILDDGRHVWTCGGCAWPHYCAGTGRCNRTPPGGAIDAGHRGRTE